MMSKLILKFTNKILSVTELDHSKSTVIGREIDCDIQIDSIRCGPRHAIIVHKKEGYLISSVDNEGFPLQVNDKIVTSPYLLNHGDALFFGDFTLEFVGSAQVYQNQQKKQVDSIRDDMDDRLWSMKINQEIHGFMQILSGSKMGRIIKLTRKSTPIGKKGRICAIINLKNNTFYISPLAEENCVLILLNGKELKEKNVQLKGGDLIETEGLKMEFQQDG